MREREKGRAGGKKNNIPGTKREREISGDSIFNDFQQNEKLLPFRVRVCSWEWEHEISRSSGFLLSVIG